MPGWFRYAALLLAGIMYLNNKGADSPLANLLVTVSSIGHMWGQVIKARDIAEKGFVHGHWSIATLFPVVRYAGMSMMAYAMYTSMKR